MSLLTAGGRISGALVERHRERIEIHAGAVVLAAGGFEASPEWRLRHLGPGWDLAPVRGTWANTGDGIRMAIDVGAQSFGHWSGAHGASYDPNAPVFGDPKIGDIFRKHCYPLGIVVNARGERFIDEGADHRSYTYASTGRRSYVSRMLSRGRSSMRR